MSAITPVNLSGVDLNLLVMLEAVLSARSATIAASRLHITQSAVSNGLKRARALFGDALVVRRGNGFSLTPRAQILAPRIRSILDNTRSLLSSGAGNTPPEWLTVACLDALSITLVPRILPLLQEHLPETRLRVMSPDHVRTLGFERSEVDLLIGAIRDVHASCDTEVLYEDPMVVVAARRHPKLKSRLTVEAYTKLPHVELSLFGEAEDRVDRALAARGLTRHVMVTVPHLAALPYLVRGSERIATVPRTIGNTFASSLGLRLYRPPVPLPPVTLRMVWHRRSASDPSHQALRDAARTAARLLLKVADAQGTKPRRNAA
jgi:DNA-binding transcriptional LysR family regulator